MGEGLDHATRRATETARGSAEGEETLGEILEEKGKYLLWPQVQLPWWTIKLPHLPSS